MLQALARAAGLDPEYTDWRGQRVTSSDETLRLALTALGVDPDRGDAVAELERRRWMDIVPPVVLAWDGELVLPFSVPAELDLDWECTVTTEEGGLFRARDGAETLLTGNECRLLAYLVRSAGQVQSREKLMSAVLQRMWDPLDRSIDVLITRLRHKIEADPKRPAIIKTIRGTGYLLSLEHPATESAA